MAAHRRPAKDRGPDAVGGGPGPQDAALTAGYAPSSEATAWDRIVERYDELLALRDTPVVRLNRAVAVAEASGAEAGLEALDSVALRGHRLPAVRAQLLERAGRHRDAIEAYAEAVALCTHGPERADLARRRDALQGFASRPVDENTF
ncbi:hypothetical protein OG984_24990 [Nocardioides sp. NBC_00368]|uniref:hypothetical protein n=1 Tax=Nocardioides sp. NBC_00368 TaxID=2976000 RepID=UPI002E1C763F